MKKTEECRRMAFFIPNSLAEKLNSIAWSNRRSMTAEVIVALEKHLAVEATKKASGTSLEATPDASE